MDVPTHGSIEPYAGGGDNRDSGATASNAPSDLMTRGSGAVVPCPVGPDTGVPARDPSPYADEQGRTSA